MELWQEAYKAIEDIHGLMILSKKVFQPKMMANYYQKLALVFLKCGNQLFHAAAIFKYFQLTREMKKNISAEELGKLASRGTFQKGSKISKNRHFLIFFCNTNIHIFSFGCNFGRTNSVKSSGI